MSVSAIGASANPTATGANSASNMVSAGGKDFASVLAAFEKAAAETPAERTRDAVLKSHGLTQKQYEALPPSQKDPITREIAAAIRRMQQATGQGGSGQPASADIASLLAG